MKWLLYNWLFAAGYLAMMPSFLLRMARRGGYRARMGDRFGFYPGAVRAKLGVSRGFVWIHAVSVGEAVVAGQLMRAMRERSPGVRFVMSVTSSTGWRQAEKIVEEGDVLVYAPLDFPSCVRRALDAVRPRAMIITETEIWPNLILELKRRSIPSFLVNARVSDRSAPRYRMLRWWFGDVLRSFSRIFAQSEADAARLCAAGADASRVETTGSFKFDAAKRVPAKESEISAWLGGGEILLGGSTWPGEDEALLRAWTELRKTHPEAGLAIVPRHFEKADAVEANIRAAGYACVRRSRGETAEGLAPDDLKRGVVFLGDTTGELMGFYGAATVVFVGKTLCAIGGQNMIEPCACAKPTIVGPHTENFRPVMADLLAADAVVQVDGEEGLAREISRLFGDPAARAALGERAEGAVARRRGSTGRCADALLASIPDEAPPAKKRPFLKRGIILLSILLAYAAALFPAKSALDREWRTFRLVPHRKFSTFAKLTAFSALCPPSWKSPREAYEAVRNRDREGMDGRATVADRLAELVPLLDKKESAERIDARGLSMARMKRILACFKKRHGGWRLWCTGRYDYVLMRRVNCLADDLADLFGDPNLFDRFADAGMLTPSDLFACYVGSDEEVEPAFKDVPEFGAFLGALTAPRVIFEPFPTNALAQVEASYLEPYYIPDFSWVRKATLEQAVFDGLTNRIERVQAARREALVGFLEAEKGDSKKALEKWRLATTLNPRDPLMKGLAESLDTEGRRRLKIGDVNGALHCYENRLEIYPDDVAAVHNFAQCLRNAGQPELAAQVFMQAAKRDPAHEEHLVCFVDCAAASGHEEDALKVLETLISRHPEDGDLRVRAARIKAAIARKNVKKLYGK